MPRIIPAVMRYPTFFNAMNKAPSKVVRSHSSNQSEKLRSGSNLLAYGIVSFSYATAGLSLLYSDRIPKEKEEDKASGNIFR